MKINFKGVDTATWVRTITLVLVLANQLATSIFKFRLIPFTDAEINEGVAVILTIGVSIFTGWKNNSFTEEAQSADRLIVKRRR